MRVSVSRDSSSYAFNVLRFIVVQGGADTQDALSCRSFFAKEPLVIELFCGK